VDREEWLSAFAHEAGVPGPTPEEVEQLLALAGTAAHASERTAAPLSCWIAGRSTLTLEQLQAVAARLAERDR
jgi:Domain of unknown function (DUF6457)